MSVSVRFRAKTGGIKKQLQGEKLEDLLGAKGLLMADHVEAAGIRVEGVPGRIPLPVTVTVTSGSGRSRARVIIDHPSGLAVEAKHGILMAAIDAAKDVA